MAVPITKSYIAKGRKNRPGYKLTIKYVTVHDTGNSSKGADAKAHASYLKGATAAAIPASWHFTVDGGTSKKAPAIYQHLPVTENGWHAGDGSNGIGNRQSVGVEICMNSDGKRSVAEKNAAWLVAKILHDNNLKSSKVRQHYHWSGKNCPSVLRKRAGGWKGFIAAVEKELKAMQKKTTTKTTSTTNYYVVKSGDTLSEIAVKLKTTTAKLVKRNNISNPNLIYTGQKIYYDAPATPAASDSKADLKNEIAALKKKNSSLTTTNKALRSGIKEAVRVLSALG